VAWIWLFIFGVIIGALNNSDAITPKTPLAYAIGVIGIFTLIVPFLTLAVVIIQVFRQPRPEPKTPSAIALRQEAEKNREKIILAIAIIAAIILGLYLFFTFVHIDLIFTLTPKTTP
jgi:predicted MFS family arabinose efflux permease